MAEKESSAVKTWDPFRDLDLFRGWFPLREFPGLRALRDESSVRWAPALDINEDDDRYVVTVELAGAKKKDVTVEVHDNVLTISGEKRHEREEKNEQRRYVERSYGSFSRSFSLPANADPDRIEARIEDGVLTVQIAKREETKPKTISVK